MMNSYFRKTNTVVIVFAALGIGRRVLPWILTRLTNRALEKVPGTSGQVGRVKINFLPPQLAVQNLSFELGGFLLFPFRIASLLLERVLD